MKFIGREKELSRLQKFLQKKTASLLVIKGRRRIGKSSLIDEFGKNFKRYWHFSGLPPESGVSAQDQRNEFCRQFAHQLKLPHPKFENWGDIFWLLGECAQKVGRVLILLDEISWMGLEDPTFLPKLKDAWDRFFKKNGELILVLCSSASSWIEKNILSGSGFVGRLSDTITLEPLPLKDATQFWGKRSIASFEKLKILSVTGGIPRYLEEIKASVPAEENLRKLCFLPGAMLVKEFKQIFSDVFMRDSKIYQEMVRALAGSAKTHGEICKAIGHEPNGRVSGYLEELRLAGFIKKDSAWQFKTGKDSKICTYRLSDNYLRFYVKYIEPNLERIERGTFELKSLTSLPEWNVVMGLQFENLVLNERTWIHQRLHIQAGEIVSENPYYQTKTTRHQACQIDYLIQTNHQNFYLCEIKFSKNPITYSVIEEVRAKMKALSLPRGFSCRPVLICAGEVTEELENSQFFSAIIDLSKEL